MSRRASVAVTVALLLVGLVAGCSCNAVEPGDDARPTATAAEVCQHLEMPVKHLRKDGLTVEEILSAQTKEAIGMRAMIALLGPWTAARAGRFRAVLQYVADRYERESPDGAPIRPDPPVAIVENARALDRFLADGGCG